MANQINYPAIHQAYQGYKGKLGNVEGAAIPQPVTHGPMHSMMVHAMSQTPSQPGEDHGSMIIRALTEHLKRMTPDVSGIHKPQTPPANHA